jgi:hypothetical protein
VTQATTLATLRDGVARQKRELHVACAALATVTRDSVKPTRWIQDNPFTCVLGAFALGHWLAGRTRRAN